MSRASELADAITPSKDNVPELGDLLSAAAELRRLERVNAELVGALRTVAFSGKFQCLDDAAWDQVNAALTSATKEQQK